MNAAEYARHRGLSRMRISQYIATGKISATKVGRGYEIDPATADRELEGSIDQRSTTAKTPRQAKPKEEQKPINVDRPLLEDRKQRVAGKSVALVEQSKGGPTYAEAQRAREVYRAERERLKLMQEKGELVIAADVKKEVTNLTRSIRDNMLSIPDRIASQIAATSTTHEVHRLLADEIRTALRVLADA